MNAYHVWLCFFSPFIGVILTPLLARAHPKLRDWGAVFFSGVSAFFALRLLPLLKDPSLLPLRTEVIWLQEPLRISFGFLLDPLSILLANVVAVISFFIMLYSLGYMKGDPSLNRYWMLMNLFIGSMLLLVLASNLLFLFVGWKLVGLCSYGLIGFYYKDEEGHWIGGPPPTRFCTPSHAGLKALIMTSGGDVFLLAGILILFFYAKTLNIFELYERASQWIPVLCSSPGMVTLLVFLLLAGPVGKSAQFPLHEWLPEAMAGPTPVSALIHAATMVKSGVYLVARLIPIFYYARWAAGSQEASLFFSVVAGIGAFTAFLAATQGMVALELKKALAYSTVSQIGYMWVGLGVAGMAPSLLVDGYTSGIFHLMSHALFKACLFLCAGSVLHAVHTIYMDRMGGLKRHMPLTWIFMGIAALSLMGVPPFPGFWSKEAVLHACLEPGNYLIFVPSMVTVALTAFYTVRFFGMVFHGPEGSRVKELRSEGALLGDGYPSMWISCGVLAAGILLLGLSGPKVEELLKEGFEGLLVGRLALPIDHPAHTASGSLSLISIGSVLLAGGVAYLAYILRSFDLATLRKYGPLGRLHAFLWNRWFIDAFYYSVIVRKTVELSSSVPKSVEDPLDNLYHRTIPALPGLLYKLLRATRTDRKEIFYNLAYVLAIFVFLFLILSWGLK